MYIVNPELTPQLITTLLSLWESSVRASHYFLTEADIRNLISLVDEGIKDVDTLIVTYDDKQPAAFIGINDKKVEMLFVSPEYFGRGIGKELVSVAINKYSVEYVDVNEQNPQAKGFYEHIGFTTFDRTELDEQGNPFPILKMKLMK